MKRKWKDGLVVGLIAAAMYLVIHFAVSYPFCRNCSKWAGY